MFRLNNKWFPFLTRSEYVQLKRYLSNEQPDFMAHQLAVILGLEYSKCIAIIAVLSAKGIVNVKLLIYHNCDPELAVGAIPFKDGYPDLPFYCEECDSYVNDYSELDFDLMAKSEGQIEIE